MHCRACALGMTQMKKSRTKLMQGFQRPGCITWGRPHGPTDAKCRLHLLGSQCSQIGLRLATSFLSTEGTEASACGPTSQCNETAPIGGCLPATHHCSYHGAPAGWRRANAAKLAQCSPVDRSAARTAPERGCMGTALPRHAASVAGSSIIPQCRCQYAGSRRRFRAASAASPHRNASGIGP
jgi:hypothetical protein